MLIKEAIYKYPISLKRLMIGNNIGFIKVQCIKLYEIIINIILYPPLLDPYKYR